MLGVGFLGTKAPFFMDFITVYFAILPILVGLSIFAVIKKRYELHYKMQLTTFLITIFVVTIFEVGVRVFGGFSTFMETANINQTFMITLLSVHILIAVTTVIFWSSLIYGTIKHVKIENRSIQKSHKKFGKILFLGIFLTSFLGVLIYFLLFIY